jgi:hypothetical protein
MNNIRLRYWTVPLIVLALAAGCSKPPPPPKPVELPHVVVTKRNYSSDFIYRGSDVTVRGDASELVVQKHGGRDTFVLLMDYELTGDFIATMEVEFATEEELGVPFRGGTPVPYYGFRSSDGSKECLYHLGTFHPKGKRYQIVMERHSGTFTSSRDGHPAKGSEESLLAPGYVCFMMNDVSRVRLHQFRLESPPDHVLIDYGTTNAAQAAPARQ